MFKKTSLLVSFLTAFIVSQLFAQTESIVSEDVVFEEVDGFAAVEAEFFYKQSKDDIRQWYRFNKDSWPKAGLDHDEPHCKGASNNAYIEILPDTRVTHGDRLIEGENFSPQPGKMALLHYKVHFNNPGRYYVWVRAYSTGSEDNGLHVGLDGEWPASGQRMQWCEGKKSWFWGSKQRTSKNHCGEPYKIFLDIEEPGTHEIAFSMREDGFEFDKFILTTEKEYRPEGVDQAVRVKSGTLPEPFPEVTTDLATKKSMINAIKHDVSGVRLTGALNFSPLGKGFEVENNYLVLDPKSAKQASAVAVFKALYKPHHNHWDIIFLGVGDDKGQTKYTLAINDRVIGSYKTPLGKSADEQSSEFCKVWKNMWLQDGDLLTVTADVDGNAQGKGRWAGIAVVPAGKGSDLVLEAIDKNASIEGTVPELPRPERSGPEISGELKRWHKVTLTFDGPETSETAEFNPFMNYKFDVTFTHPASGKKYVVPGYFAADGDAGNTSATKGNKWRVHFAPDEVGDWVYLANFRKGNFAAVSEKQKTGVSAGFMDGNAGAFRIADTDKTGRDFRGKGMLQYVGERYLKFAGNGEYFLKVGPDAPENMLAYEEFDGTFHSDGHADHLVKTWEAHEKHWQAGDPTWKNGKGKDIIGAINYLASKGCNVFSFITNNIKGDDKNVFPYIDYDTYDRFDCSKLDQWEVLFSHADKIGMFMHFKLMEVENQGLLDNGGVGALQTLYYREIIARFGHHLALNWNMCEENGDWVKNNRTPPQFTRQRLAMAGYFADHDPYGRHIVIHNGNQFYDLLGPNSPYTGVSVQTHRTDFGYVHDAVLKWINESKKAGKQWAVACDEPGDASHSLVPDDVDPEHNDARKNGLWGAMMAGAWGTEWYFGYKEAHSDLTCQDYASRDLFWDQGRIALDFFNNFGIPFWEMHSHDELIHTKGDYGFAKPGEVYVFFLKQGKAEVDLSSAPGEMTVQWYNPRKGGDLQTGSVKTVSPGSKVDLGTPPSDAGEDWAVLVTKQ
ncbi:MAG: DUF5060 domain-containing protein [Verrucomicrobiota bacterium]